MNREQLLMTREAQQGMTLGKRWISFASVALCLISFAAARVVHADDFVWIGPTSAFSDWNTQSNWTNTSPGGTSLVPGDTDTANFNTNAITGGGTVSNLVIADTATLSIGMGAIMVSRGIVNHNILTFDAEGAASGAEYLLIDGPVTLSGGGEVRLIDTQTGIVGDGSTGAMLTNLDNFVHCTNGCLIEVPMINQGLIRADTGLLFFFDAMDNSNGTIQLLSGATLYGAEAISHGTLACQGGGFVAQSTFDGITNTGTTTISPSGFIHLQNTITNSGTIAGYGAGETVYLDGTAVTLNGGGDLQLINSTSSLVGSPLINVDNVIHGGDGAFISAPVTNHGTIRSDSGLLDFQNTVDTDGTVQTKVGGLAAGQYSIVRFGSNTTLAGTLEITFANGFLPHAGDVFRTIQLDGQVTGNFSQIIFHGVAQGFKALGQIANGFFEVTAQTDAAPAPIIVSPLSATGTANQLFIYQIVSLPNATSYDASPLPSGLSIDSTTGIISGVPTQAGTTQVNLSATGNGTGNAVLALTIQPQPAGPIITSGTGSSGRTGQPFTFQVTTTGTSSAAQLSAGGLPPGLTADPVSGLISGTPTQDGSFRVTLTITDGPAIATGTLQLTFTSDPAFPLIISSQSAAVSSGDNFFYQIVAQGTGNTFGLIGPLPQGLTFNAQTGTISGVFSPPISPRGKKPNQIDLAGGIITNVELFAVNNHGTSIIPLIFFLGPTGTVNISTRLAINSGGDALIAGFIISGNAPKKVIIRALGPSLPVPGAMQDTVLELHDDAALLASNDDWRESQESQIIATTLAPSDNRESAIVAYLDPGTYTAVVNGKNGNSGVSIVEVYDLGTASLSADSHAQLAEISTRGTVLTGDNVMIGGFIIAGAQSRVIVRAIGPSLTDIIPGALQDTVLELRDGSGTLVTSDDDWRSNQEQEIIATGVPPSDNRESAIVATLNPGAYTGILYGKNNATGVALVEVYQLQLK